MWHSGAAPLLGSLWFPFLFPAAAPRHQNTGECRLHPGAWLVLGIILAASTASLSPPPTWRLACGQAMAMVWLVPAAPLATESHHTACPHGRVMPAEHQQSGKAKVLDALKCN